MTKAEHLARIIAKLKEYDEHPAGLDAGDALADELAELWAIVNVATSASPIDGLWTLVERAQRAELAADAHAVELLKCEENAEAAIDALRARNAALVDRLVRLHRAVTEEGASEKIVLILAEPEPEPGETPAGMYPGRGSGLAALERAERAERAESRLHAEVATLADRLARIRDAADEAYSLAEGLDVIRAIATEPDPLDESKGPVTPR